MSCLGCQRCETGPVVTLIDGSVVCNYCPAFRLECEARTVLAMPTREQRREYLHGITEGGRVVKKGVLHVRGEEACRELEAAIRAVHAAGRRE